MIFWHEIHENMRFWYESKKNMDFWHKSHWNLEMKTINYEVLVMKGMKISGFWHVRHAHRI